MLCLFFDLFFPWVVPTKHSWADTSFKTLTILGGLMWEGNNYILWLFFFVDLTLFLSLSLSCLKTKAGTHKQSVSVSQTWLQPALPQYEHIYIYHISSARKQTSTLERKKEIRREFVATLRSSLLHHSRLCNKSLNCSL